MEKKLQSVADTTAILPWHPSVSEVQPRNGITGSQELRRLLIHFAGNSFPRLTEQTFPNSRLRRTYEFEGILVNILAGFVNLPGGEVDRQICQAFGRVCPFLGVERAHIWQTAQPGADSFSLTHTWVATAENSPTSCVIANSSTELDFSVQYPNFSSLPPGSNSKECFPWLTAQIQHGKTILFSRVADLPQEADHDKLILATLSTRSGVLIPLLVQGQVLGAVGFDALTAEQAWPDLLVRRLELVTEIFADALARKRVEEARINAENLLRESESRFRTIADSAPVLIWMSGRDKLCDFFNKPWLDFTGRSLEQELGNGWVEGVHPEDRQGCLQTYVTAFEARQPFVVQYRLRRHDGQYRWLSDNGVPRYDRNGACAGYIGSCVDITERKLAEQALANSYAEIKQLKDSLQAESDYLRTEIKINQAHGEIIGRSPAIKKVLHQVEQVAPADCAVLINGETGTGKELIAQEIHRLSGRKDRLMVLVNCAALPSALVESELFGRERGAYTGALTSQVGRFEMANHSTIFLDEVGELSMEVQAKLLRVLQQGEFERLGSPKTHKVNVRVLAATNRDLAAEVRKGRFREDLYYRLKVFPIVLPSLRERIEDISLLVFAFMEEFSLRMGKKITRVPRKAMEALQEHSWPGNIRELRNVIEHSVILSSGDVLKLSMPGEAPIRDSHVVTLAEAEREHILKALESTGWRIKGPHGAASRLALQPSTLYSRMQKLGIPHRRQKDEMASQG